MVRPLALFLSLFLLASGVAYAADDVRALVRRLGSGDPRQRAEAAALLSEVRTPAERARAVAGLQGVLADPVALVRGAAAAGLARLGDPRVGTALQARLDAEVDPEALCAVLVALGELRVQAGGARIAELATIHPVPTVRAAALTALGHLGGESARRVVLDQIRRPRHADVGWAVRSAAMLALARCGHADDIGVVLVAYREGGGAQHWFARCALAKLVAERDRDPLPLLRQFVLDGDPRVAVTAATGIAKTRHLEEIRHLLNHSSASVRSAACAGIARIGVEAAYPRLRGMARLDPSLRVQWAASLALFRVEDRVADELVLRGLAAREPTIWAEAIAALNRRTGASHGRNIAAWREELRRWRLRR